MTNTPSGRLIAVAVLALTLPAAATAQQAIAAKSVNVRAGPGRDYPLIAQVGPGAPLAVQGCLQNYSWCDVIVPGNGRGWVYAGNISYPYQNTEVPLVQYGAVIGLPIVGFVLGSYWGDHYRNRPFYGNRGRWEHRPVPNGPAFRPPRQGFAGPGPEMRPPPGRPGDGGRFGGQGRPTGDPHGNPGIGPGGDRPGGGGRPGGFGGRPGGGGRPDGGGRPGGGGHPEGGGGGRGGGGDHGGRPGR